MQQIVNRVRDISFQHGLEINVVKTKWMVIHKKEIDASTTGHIYIGSEEVERVDKFLYLGTWFRETGDQNIEIKTRIEKAKATFNAMTNLSLHMRLVR